MDSFITKLYDDKFSDFNELKLDGINTSVYVYGGAGPIPSHAGLHTRPFGLPSAARLSTPAVAHCERFSRQSRLPDSTGVAADTYTRPEKPAVVARTRPRGDVCSKEECFWKDSPGVESG